MENEILYIVISRRRPEIAWVNFGVFFVCGSLSKRQSRAEAKQKSNEATMGERVKGKKAEILSPFLSLPPPPPPPPNKKNTFYAG